MLKYTPLLLLLLLGAAGITAQPRFPRYRDLQVYTTSAPEQGNPAKIVAATTFVNRGKAALKIGAMLKAEPAVGFAGTKHYVVLAPGKSAVWTWSFTPPDGLARVILTGSISINGRPERDLYVAVQGPDPADIPEGFVEKITERARVVATYAPRAQSSIRAEIKQLEANAKVAPTIGYHGFGGPTRGGYKPVPTVTLASNGKTDYAIIVDCLPDFPEGQDALAFWRKQPLTAPQQELVDALDDLRRCVKIQSGAELPFRHNTGERIPWKPPLILLSLRDTGLAAKGLQDGYFLQLADTRITIEAENLDGLRNGIYGLLTDHLDVRWYAPRQLGEEIPIPPNHTIKIPFIREERKGSRWFSTGGATWGYDTLWDRRTRAVINRGRMNFGHSWYGYVNKGEFPYEKYPDYYARDREGKIRLFDSDWSSTNFCSTHPEVLDIVAKKVNAYFAANPDAPICSLDPNDYGPMCLCDRCLALDKQYGQTSEDGTDVSDRMLHFSNEIYKRLDPKYQDKYLGILIYAYQMELPKSAKPHPHHAGMICNFPPRYDFSRPWNDPTSAVNRHFYELVKGWGGMLTQFGYYDYYDHYWYFGPWGVMFKMREDLPAFRELGGTFLMLEADANFGIQGMNNYLSAWLQWDLDADVDLLMDDYFRGYYGPAADPMRKFFLASERYFALERPGISTETRVAMRPEFWTELDGYLQQAEKAVANLPAAQQRFTDRIRLNRDGFEYGKIVFEYDLKYNRVARKLGTVDHAAAIKFLQDHREDIEGRLAKYPLDSPYWPALLPAYSQMNVDARIKNHQDEVRKGHDESMIE
ncbi:MAG: DUF4838 domain-containing protein [Armatimonadota bacterium]